MTRGASSSVTKDRRFSGPRTMQSWLTWLSVAAALAIVVCFFHWTVKTSGGFNPPGEEDYYNFLVRGWRSGHLHMSKEPSAEMLALADPYDPSRNGPHRLADASYFQGRYYLYFGAVPAAVLMLPYYLITGKELGTTTTIFVFVVVGFFAASALWLSIRKRFFAESVWWMAPLGILVLGFATHALALQRRPLVWELPIAAAYGFSMLALLLLFRLVSQPSNIGALGTGLCFGLAVGSRPTYLFAAAALVPAILFLWRKARSVRTIGFLVGSFLFCVSGVLAHNYARFGNPLEFGQNFQLTSIYESKAEHFSLSYVIHNFAIYYFQPPEWSLQFPFLAATVERTGPPGYLAEWNEPVCGIAVTLPSLWLVLALPWATWRREAREKSEISYAMAMMAASFLGMSGVTLAYFLATPRYMADFTPTLALLALCGALSLERLAADPGWRYFVGVCITILGITTAIAGVIISFDYHDKLLKKLSPDQWRKLEVIAQSILD